MSVPPFPHERSPGGQLRCTVVDSIDVAGIADDKDMGVIHMKAPDGRTLAWKFDAQTGRQFSAAILNLCDDIDGKT